MASLSNFFRPRDPGQSPGSTPICRPVERQEIESALRLILADSNGLASDEAVLDFLAFALQRKIDVNEIWVAIVGHQIVWALLPIISPGRTMLLFTPNRLPLGTPPDAAHQLTDQICSHWQNKNVNLAQLLLDPADQNVQELYVDCGFEVLAELIYLQKSVFEPVSFALPAGFEIIQYSTESHADFARVILHSYEQSLDCPSLNGRRDIQDVIAGHKASGIFEPSMWHLLRENRQDRGVLILSPSPHNESIELVYLGITPEARGRGIGTLLLRYALNSVHATGRKELTLAVDALNTPALKLYYRHGMKRLASRMALIRELKCIPVVSQ